MLKGVVLIVIAVIIAFVAGMYFESYRAKLIMIGELFKMQRKDKT